MIPDIFDSEYKKEVYKRFNEGGILYFIERTDTNKFLYEPLRTETTADLYIPDVNVEWTDNINLLTLSKVFLTKEDAEKNKPKLSQGGCRYCEHGSKPIPIEITEHEFVATHTPRQTMTEKK